VRMETSIASTTPLEKTGAVQETLSEIQQIRRWWVTNDQEASGYLRAESMTPVWQMLNGILQCYRDYRRDLIQAEAKASAVYETAKASIISTLF